MSDAAPPPDPGFLATIRHDVAKAPSILGWAAAGAAIGYLVTRSASTPLRLGATGAGLVAGFLYGDARALGFK